MEAFKDSNEKTKRIEWIDTAKGIGIILVVIGHALIANIQNDLFWANEVFRYIYSFHMPFFLFVSGITFSISLQKSKNYTIKEYIHKKAINLLVPYFLYSIIILIIFFIITRISIIHELLAGSSLACDNIKSLFLGILIGNNEQCSHLWFLYALFLIEVIAFVCVKKTKNAEKVLFSISGATYLIKTLVNIGVFSFIPQSILSAELFNNFSNCWIYFVLGYIIKNTGISKIYSTSMWIPITLSAILLNAAGLGINSSNVIPIVYFIYRVLILLIKIFLIEGLLCFSIAISKKITFFTRIGTESMTIYLFHQPICCTCLCLLLYQFVGLSAISSIVITCFSSVILPIFMVKLSNLYKPTNVFMSILLGKASLAEIRK